MKEYYNLFFIEFFLILIEFYIANLLNFHKFDNNLVFFFFF